MAFNVENKYVFSKSTVLGACDNQFKIAEELTVHIRFPDSERKFFPKGFLVHGPGGTGKSTFVKELARKCNMSIISVCAADLMFMKRSEMENKCKDYF
uniref:ATPase AAA-type core domain-containing protein n=1 Tax=Ditylenchus dipsaci TaxID=166011 RepID=A0A915DWW2_9BILA